MIGALLGDLAAWTWINDNKKFYPNLISCEAEKSIYSEVLLSTAETLAKDPKILPKEFEMSQRAHFNYYSKIPHLTVAQYSVIRAIAIGWIYSTLEDVHTAVQAYILCEEKEEWYTSHFLAALIFSLRHGATKKDAMIDDNFIGNFHYFVNNPHTLNGDGVLSKLVSAWHAFYNAYDFGSTLHNAIHIKGDITFNCMLAGALADAMYGCNNYFVKSKYKGGGSLLEHVHINDTIYDIYRRNRKFFPKNNALTNVDKHTWVDTPYPFDDKVISEELHNRILKAFHTTFDYRFGFYLENGWIYVYRSLILLSRFKLTRQKDNTYRITHYQVVNDNKDFCKLDNTPLIEALYAVEHCWDWVSNEY